ncbi:MAG: efflux RND transporter permease subunit, partial [Candidatus Kapabacteria bacterium]|nr:efflux RND transporter permease subunit [Candidatus Kapabacteria bacterium]
TIISFLPVFAMEAAEGKLFRPLAFTKTYALLSALFIGIVFIPTFAHWLFSMKLGKKLYKKILNSALFVAGIVIAVLYVPWAGIALSLVSASNILSDIYNWQDSKYLKYINFVIILLAVFYILAKEWLPLGAGNSLFTNILFVGGIIALILGILMTVVHFYSRILRWCLDNKKKFLSVPIAVIILGIISWQGLEKTFGFVADGTHAIGIDLRHSSGWQSLAKTFPGIGSEFMPPLDEGSFLLMPTTMPHSGIEENIEVIRFVDMAVTAIPEVEITVGKWGRVNSALDPAPISMFENTINYKPEYKLDENGHRLRFKVDDEGQYERDTDGKLIKYPGGEFFRNWRDHIKSPNDIWDEIVKVANYPGLTSAPKLQPIETRLVMLSTGMRAPMGMKIYGPDLKTIEAFGFEMENVLKDVPSIKTESVFADRVVGKPYLEIHIDRKAAARYGITISDIQSYISVAVGGMKLSTSVEGRERFPIRVRYAREFRDNPADILNILIPASDGVQIPLNEVAEIKYVQGPQMIKSEDTFLNSYVIFDKNEGHAEVDVIEEAQRFIKSKIESGELVVPPGVKYKFAGNYENQLRASKRLAIVIPISLIAIFLILYFQFGNLQTTSMVFSGVFVAFSGGFIMLWLYSQGWFLNFSIAGMEMRDLFQVHTINASVAVWVGFIALFGVATDDGVLMGTYLTQVIEKEKPKSVNEIRTAVIHAGQQRVRPAVMTTATTIIALLPILTSTGKGSDIMIPMAIPSVGGMTIQVMTMFIVPVLYSVWQERKLRNNQSQNMSISDE